MTFTDIRVNHDDGSTSRMQGYYSVEGEAFIDRIWNPAITEILPLFKEFEELAGPKPTEDTQLGFQEDVDNLKLLVVLLTT